jgi:hypothetical protein
MVVHHGDYLISWQPKFLVRVKQDSQMSLALHRPHSGVLPVLPERSKIHDRAPTHDFTGASALFTTSEEYTKTITTNQ